MREAAILSRRAAAALPLAALLGPATAPVPAKAAPDDAALADLGRRWQAAVAAERAHAALCNDAMSDAETEEHEATGEDLHDVTSRLFEQIVGTPATTAAGLAVKGRVLTYENDLDDLDEASVAAALTGARYYTDRAAFSLALDCLRLARAAA